MAAAAAAATAASAAAEALFSGKWETGTEIWQKILPSPRILLDFLRKQAGHSGSAGGGEKGKNMRALLGSSSVSLSQGRSHASA